VSEENKALLRRLYDGISTGNLAVADEVIATDAIEHLQMPPGIEGTAAEMLKQFMTVFRSAFPDLHVAPADMIAEGDKVVSRLSITGTHKGDFMGVPASGRQINIESIEIVRFAGGKAVEHWEVVDNMALMQQIGAIAGP
jgi:steroid delta-isomerase-like uncharacterized protein